MLNKCERLQVLNEAFSFVRDLSNRVIVIKYGGSAMKNAHLKNKVMHDLLLLSSLGIKLVLIHGGGPMIDTWLKRCNIQPKFSNGIRVTDQQTMEIVEMVLIGKVNKDLVSLLNNQGNSAIGLSGKDGNLIYASPMFDNQNTCVGKVDSINIEPLNLLLNKGYIPVIASVATGYGGKSYNINADTAASSIASALNAEKLILLTDTPGIMLDVNNPDTLLPLLDINKVKILKDKKIISGGMIPKINCAIHALEASVKSVHIIDGKVEHALLLEVLTKNRIGSMLTL